MRAYRALLRDRRLLRLIVAGPVARLPSGMVGLAALLVVEQRTGSVAWAGMASALTAFGVAVSGPHWGRLADLRGPRTAVGIAAPLEAAALLGLAAADTAAAAPLLALCALVGLGSPPISAVIRALWPRLAPDRAALSTLYALDATVQELIFIVGPALVALAVAVASPVAAVVLSAAVGLGGSALVLSDSATRRRDVPLMPAGPGALRPLLALIALVLLLTTGIGHFEVGLPAYAVELDRRALGGVLLAILSAGSLLGGLVAGARVWSHGAAERIGPLAALCAVTAVLAALAPGTVGLAVVLVAAGAGIAPTLAAASELVHERVPEAAATRAFAWLVSAIVAGLALGSALAGVLAEIAGARWAIAAGALPMLAAALLARRPAFLAMRALAT